MTSAATVFLSFDEHGMPIAQHVEIHPDVRVRVAECLASLSVMLADDLDDEFPDDTFVEDAVH